MKRKIVGILITMLLIATVVLPVSSGMKASKTVTLGPTVLDQEQKDGSLCVWITGKNWQEFTPTYTVHKKIEAKIGQGYEGSPDLEISIEKPLGTKIDGKTIYLKATDIPSGSDWVPIVLDDMELTKGQKYYIVLNAPSGSEYSWCGSNTNPYAGGASSEGPGFDFCFRTFAEDRTVKNIPNPIMKLFSENFPFLFRIVQQLLF